MQGTPSISRLCRVRVSAATQTTPTVPDSADADVQVALRMPYSSDVAMQASPDSISANVQAVPETLDAHTQIAPTVSMDAETQAMQTAPDCVNVDVQAAPYTNDAESQVSKTLDEK